jgi:hypothetical protein
MKYGRMQNSVHNSIVPQNFVYSSEGAKKSKKIINTGIGTIERLILVILHTNSTFQIIDK